MDHTRLSSGSDVADEADAVASPIDDGSYKKDFKYRKNQIKLFFKDLFPFLKWLPLYHFREDILSDCLAGLTVSPPPYIFVPLHYSFLTLFTRYPFAVCCFQQQQQNPSSNSELLGLWNS